MDKIIWLIKSIPIKGVCSFITLTEVLPKPIEMENQKLIQAYRQIIFKSEEFICKPVDKVIAIMAAELRAAYKIKTPDAIHLATAIRDNCDAFLTNDVRLKQVNNIRVLVLEELELDTPENGKSFTPIPPST